MAPHRRCQVPTGTGELGRMRNREVAPLATGVAHLEMGVAVMETRRVMDRPEMGGQIPDRTANLETGLPENGRGTLGAVTPEGPDRYPKC